MKKILALLLVMMLVFSLAACGNNDDNPSGSDNPGTSNQEQTDNTDNSGNGDVDGSPDNGGGTEKETSDEPAPSGGEWPTEGMATLVPAPNFDYTVMANNEKLLTIAYNNVGVDALKAYTEDVKSQGFVENEVLVDTDGYYSWQAFNSDGYSVTIGLQTTQINAPN